MIHFKDIDGQVYGYKATDTCVEITYEELDTLLAPSADQQEIDRVNAIKAKCGEIIYAKYSVPKQTNVLLGLEEESYGNTMKAFITAMRQQCRDLIADPTKTLKDYIIPEEEK